tara:strand:- start:2528 stop:3796 length:1269 start_codon:yes stop_codon:yes gene_type:complete
MKCNRGWKNEFIVLKLNRSYVLNDYRKHRKELLLDMEISKLPMTMEAASKVKLINEEQKKKNMVEDEINKLQQALTTLKNQVAIHNKEINMLNGRAKFGKGTNNEKQKFIMHCPSDNCRGFLSIKYKCDLCGIKTCSKCLEIISEIDVEHVCNKDSVKTREMIQEQTRPCPSCGVRIYKISGCNQMWCTECNTAFGWKTGKIEKGVVHNPHYFEYLNNVNNRHENRINAEENVECNTLCDYAVYNQIKIKLKECGRDSSIVVDSIVEWVLMEQYRFARHVIHYEIPGIRNKITILEDNKSLRVEYILGMKTKEQLSTYVYRNDNLRKKNTEILQIFELLGKMLIEMFVSLTNGIKNTKELFYKELLNEIKQLDKLFEYCNNEFEKISITYNQTTPYIEFAKEKREQITIKAKKSCNYVNLLS